MLLTRSDGTLLSSDLTLDNGTQTTTWTAPGAVPAGGIATVIANYQGHSYAGVDYNAANPAPANISVVAQNRATTTTGSVPTSTTTRAQVNISATIKDATNQALVNGGTVTFSCATGRFSNNSTSHAVSVANGNASDIWTAPNTSGTYAIKADYSGWNAGAIIYGASTDSDNIFVDYTNVNTATTVTCSSDYPYINGYSYVIVDVKDTSSNPVPTGSVAFSAPKGYFDNNTRNIAGGRCHTIWHAPSTAGDVTVTANYAQTTAGGNRYQASSNTGTEHVVHDTDTTGDGLAWQSDWTSDYSTNPLPNAKEQSRGFTGKLTGSLGWAGAEYSNDSAWEDDMKSSAHNGDEDKYLDVHDLQWYNGHGNGDKITFITNHDDNDLLSSEVEDSWGDKDCEWIALKTCLALSKEQEWGKALNGAHMILGFSTNAQSSTKFGSAFAGAMIRDAVCAPPHTVEQSWWLAGDMTHGTDRKQRIVAENDAMFDDYIWGMGKVAPDPVVDATKVAHSHDVTTQHRPVANAGGPYLNVKAGQVVQLDGSRTTDVDVGDIITYAWDLDNTANNDNGDWDNDGFDQSNDDADAWGLKPSVIFPVPKVYVVTLTAIDQTWKTHQAQVAISVAAPGKAFVANAAPEQVPKPNDGGGGGGAIEIIDNYPGLPPEVVMPVFNCTSAPIGYTELSHIASYYGISGEAGLDDLGNWRMVGGENELIVNQHTCGVTYLNSARAYRWMGMPSNLPDEEQCIQIAQQWLYQNEIGAAGYVFKDVTQLCREAFAVGSRTRTSTPYQRRVNFMRTMNAFGTPYPVVGPGGRITVMIDGYTSDPNMFVKVGRDALEGDEVTLNPPGSALADLHRIGLSALIGGSCVPDCDQIYIDNVSVGYYEDDFLTPQSKILPVYALDLTCVDEKTSQQVQVWLPATDPPLDVAIASPADDTAAAYGQSVTFTATVAGGKLPYTLQWDSDKDGVIGSALSFSTDSLTCNQRSSEPTRHTITLTVTDANGWKSCKMVTILVTPTSVQDAKKSADDTTLAVLGSVVTASFDDYFYVETPDRVSGIGVLSTAAPPENSIVAVYGKMGTLGHERLIDATTVEILGTTDPIRPLFMTIGNLGGGPFGTPPLGQAGVDGGRGLNNVGLLARIAGRVDNVGTGAPLRFVMSDGSPLCHTYVLPPEGTTLPAAGNFCLVTGVSSIGQLPSGALWRAVIVRRASDIEVLYLSGHIW